MAEPITWRSLAGGNTMPVDASYPLRGATDALTQGFTQLQKTLGMVTDNDQANWNNQKVNNTNALANELRLAKTPEQMAALEASGRLDQMRQAMGAQFDAEKINALEDNRMNVVRDNLTRAQQFQEAQQLEAEKPLARAYEMARINNDKDTMARIEASNPDALFLPKQMEARRNQMMQDWRFQREGVKAGYEDAEQPLKLNLTREQILASEAGRRVAQQNANNGTQNANSSELTAMAQMMHYLGLGSGAMGTGGKGGSGGTGSGTGSKTSDKNAYNTKQEDGGLVKGTIDNAEGITNAVDALKKVGLDQQQIDSVFENVRKYYPKGMAIGEKDGQPIYTPITVSALVEAASQVPEERKVVHFFGGSVRGDNTRIMLDRNYAYRLPNGEINKDQKKEKVLELQAALEARNQRMNPTPSGPAAPNPTQVLFQNLLNNFIANNPRFSGEAQKKTPQ